MLIRSLIAVTLALPAPLAAQVLTLQDALGRAEIGAYANRLAVAGAQADAARAGAALRGILPSLRAEAGWMRTTDPVGAFGITLRQRAVTPAAFAPAALNDPAGAGDVATGLVLEIPLLNPDAWLGRAAARGAGDASAAAARWTATRTAVDVVRAYYGAQLAAEKATTLEAAARAARDHVRAAEAMAAGGMATRSDALLADVRAGEVAAELARARADAGLARRSLAVLLGSPADSTFTLPDALPDTTLLLRVARLPADSGTAARADLDAARLGLGAARDDRRRAASLYLPRVNGFARYDWHARTNPFGGQPSWTLGVMASWSPFSGGAEIAENRTAAARLAGARAGLEAAEAQAGLETARVDADLAVALERQGLAARAVVQSAEAHRLVGRRYASGLATVVELLDAAAVDMQTQLRFSAARYDVLVAVAARLQSRGQSLLPLVSLDR